MTIFTTALVTGSSSGLGFETAAQLAEQSYARVVVTARTGDKADATVARLQERTGSDVFEPLTLDLDDLASVRAAVQVLQDRRAGTLDVLVLNAGLVSSGTVVRSEAGIERTFSASLVGHHVLTVGLLEAGLVSNPGRIIIAGSEAARSDVMNMKVTDLPELARRAFDGDQEAAARSLITGNQVDGFKAATAYADAKAFVVRWAHVLSRQLPDGISVNTVSPGSVPDTGAARHAPLPMKLLLGVVFKTIGGRIGLAQSVSEGAGRYLSAIDYPDDLTGEFFASPPGKMIGPMEQVDIRYLNDEASRQAVWSAVTDLSDARYAHASQ